MISRPQPLPWRTAARRSMDWRSHAALARCLLVGASELLALWRARRGA